MNLKRNKEKLSNLSNKRFFKKLTKPERPIGQYKKILICVIRDSEKEEKEGKKFEETMAENFSNLMSDINLQIQEMNSKQDKFKHHNQNAET